jgi:hypothetical protein
MKNKSVKGLANIAQLLNRGDLAVAPAAPKRERRSCIDIETKTNEKIVAAVGLQSERPHTDAATAQIALLANYVRAAVRDAYNLGHADALDQNSQVERLLEKQYQKRTEVTMPAVVAGIMEQLGMSAMTLDLAHLATVFDRNQISYVFNDDTNVMEYTMRPAGVDA